ncbi:hypothetical protein COU76_00540 [Candidatus Peregrinibacteria bacterium CG10_big_fil_rev_8_21_14_0_10_49_10]|nr:MAG: hypothetical protein COU76_00540 [Candidatus Peregrinibacteria bacterium CG10_big_fil_rev_8_21_14_0_10_49_10]
MPYLYYSRSYIPHTTYDILFIPWTRYACFVHPSSPAQVIAAAGTEAFLVSNLVNVRYISGVDVSEGMLLITPRSAVLFVDGRYSEVASKDVRRGTQVRPLASLPTILGHLAECGCESEAVTLAQFRNWKRKFKNTKFIQKSKIVEQFRRTKDADEVRKFRRAQQMTTTLLTRVPDWLRGEITEKALARTLRTAADELGADGLSFEPIVAFGTHTSRPHHHPTTRRLRTGNIVQIDVGVRYGGYCADQSAVFFTGKKTQKQQRVLQAVQEAKDTALALVRSGVSTHTLDKEARRVLRSYGLEKYFIHSLGHGVGLEIHEGARISLRVPEEFLQKGEIVTIEPGVYIPGQFGVRLEEEVVVA